ncbi:YegS/Rv2252/BmrU family lipid kinase [Bacillus sonorensis]|uniref:Diacylglycerol/lipid kinase YtlR n=2 Tax=Bacillus sonorensis TaxID=119858 RepID=M5PAX4_9BACI|nr:MULTISPECIES: YegS/Rv2252/BmrU family lipid kinase [Bacillus]TWK74181.1 putative lipid kinase YtlR [Bacillus paralicheniformis]ASB87876.1 Ceramide kinase [Bacillus sonorensis]EME76724.1 diacylglycerol/lipid kinase YtlR [Bacillus sonorensis L12]MBG9915777.1 lipid kinase [Bacillus sonorensis]MCY8027065.1 YegS/Rv2252/BmrU family lipid kinase [Bacillus sonorensis]
MSEWYIIINPKAGRSSALRVWKSLQKELQKTNISYRSFMTQHPGHAEVLARQISTIQDDRLKRLLIIGGDGTIHEVLNGLISLQDIQLSVIPAGSANDFKRGFSIKKSDVVKGLKKAGKSLTRTYALGSFQPKDSGSELYFANHLSIGFDACIAKKISELPKWTGILKLNHLIQPFLFLAVAFTFKPFVLSYETEGEKHTFKKIWFASVSNHPYYGGGMKIAPHANPREELLDVTIIEDRPMLKKAALLFAMSFGKHLGADGVTSFKTKDIYLHTNERVLFQADGEVIGSTPVFVKTGEEHLRLKA